MARKSLRSLFEEGVEVVWQVGDATETVWLDKPRPATEELTSRKAQAARARYMMSYQDKTSEDYLAVYSMAESLLSDSEDAMAHILVAKDVRQFQRTLEAETAAEDEWAKDGYLEGLRDSWFGIEGTPGLQVRYAENPENPEAKRVYDELARFDKFIAERVDFFESEAVADKVTQPRERLIDEIATLLLANRADAAQSEELTRWRFFQAVRTPADHKVHYWDSIEEFDEDWEYAQVKDKLLQAMQDLVVPVEEGKGLPATPGS